MLQRIDLGRALLVLGALLLVAALFLDWYDVGGTGWEVFEALDLLLAALALGVTYAALRGADRAPAFLRYAPFAVLAIVLVQILNPPPVLQLAGDALNVDGASDPDTGAWLALAGAALMTAGAILALAHVSVTIDVTDREPGAPAWSGGPADDVAAEAPTTVAPAQEEPVTTSRRSASLLGDDRPTPSPPIKGGPAPDPETHPAAPLKPGPSREPQSVREVPAVDHRAGRTAPAGEPDPTQPLRVTPDDPS